MSAAQPARSSVTTARPAAGRDARRHRPEIEGLRAVAAVLVLVFHVFVGRVSGGVDVFFVVAGFLITLILLGQAVRQGALDAARYVSRLMTRLLPLGLGVLLVVALGTLVLAPAWYRPPWLRQVGWSALYAENWSLAGESTVYLAQGLLPSPVQHFWAMSMQGQFYALWFALFAAALVIARRTGHSVRLTSTVVIGATVVASFALAVNVVGAPGAYFNTAARAWEFGAGALVALAITRWGPLGRRTGVLLGWLGLALILATGPLVGDPALFPGPAALAPVLGAVLVLLAGDSRGAQARGSATRLLASRPLVALGGVSYALYLWHWPLLIWARTRTMDGSVSLHLSLLVVAASFALAFATTRLFDQPVRARLTALLPPARLVWLGASSIALVALTAFALAQTTDASLRGTVGEDRTAVVTNLASAREDFPQPYLDGCVQQLGEGALIECAYGAVGSDVTVMLAGGSHAAHWFPALEVLAEQRGWRLVVAAKDACRFTSVPAEQSLGGPTCGEWNAELLQRILDDPPDLLVTTGTVSDGGGEGLEFTPDGYVERWHALGRAGVPVLAIRDTPRWPVDPIDCLWARGVTDAACSVPRERSLAGSSPLDRVAGMPASVTVADLTDALCDATTCPATIDGTAVYWDVSHLTATYARSLAPRLAAALPDITG